MFGCVSRKFPCFLHKISVSKYSFFLYISLNLIYLLIVQMMHNSTSYVSMQNPKVQLSRHNEVILPKTLEQWQQHTSVEYLLHATLQQHPCRASPRAGYSLLFYTVESMSGFFLTPNIESQNFLTLNIIRDF